MAGASRDSKAQATHVAAMKIVAAEKAQHLMKTARLRQLRLAQQGKADEEGKSPEAK
ncbi:MAG: hypothetical protein AB7S92_16375 [Parvibaculaceae bacterium]